MIIMHSRASTKRLQSTYLANMLVNISGDDEKIFEVDRLVEFLNRLVSLTKARSDELYETGTYRKLDWQDP